MSFFIILIFLFKKIYSLDIEIYTNSSFILFDKNTSLAKYYTYDTKKDTFSIKFQSFFSYGSVDGDKKKEGDLKTPEGVYFIEEKISRHELPKYFGAGAFKLNYPNPIDILENKSGSNIWIHGTDDSNKLELSKLSKGCIVLNNQDLIKAAKFLRINETPVLIIDNLNKIKFKYSKNFKIKVKDKLNYIVNKEKNIIRYTYEK